MTRIVEEANFAFQLNRDVMQALEADVETAIGSHVFALITRQEGPGSTESHLHRQVVESAALEYTVS